MISYAAALHPFNVPLTGAGLMQRQIPPCIAKYRLEEYMVNVAEEPVAVSETQLLPISLLEAALFLAKEPMASRRLIQLAGLPEKTKIQPLVSELNLRYEQDQSAFCIVEIAEGYQLRTRSELAVWLAKMQEIPQAVRLSTPAMETLTVIAYRQPILRAEVERIRGVQCGDLIRQLLDQDLARIVGRSEDLGRPFLYGTTSQFLKVFGLKSLNDLPPLNDINPSRK